MADANAITLADYAVQSNNPLVMEITKSLLKTCSIFWHLPIVTKPSLEIKGVRWEGNLPTIDWRGINDGVTVTKGKPTPYEERVFFIRNAIDVDHILLQEQNAIINPMSLQIDAVMESLNYDINDKFINNSHTAGDADCFVGVRNRLDNYGSWGLFSELNINCGGLDIRPSAVTAATANSFIDYLDQMLSYLGRPDGNGVVIYFNDQGMRAANSAVRTLGAGAGFSMMTDAFERRVLTYRNAIILDIGRKADQTTRIITSTETAAGADGASTFTSCYAVKYGIDGGIVGAQFMPLKPEYVGKIGGDGTMHRILVEYGIGLVSTGTRSVARMFNWRSA